MEKQRGNSTNRIRWASVLIVGILTSSLSEALHRSRRRSLINQNMLAVTLASIGDGVITTDTRGLITFINAIAESLTGWKSQEAIGRPLTLHFLLADNGDGVMPLLTALAGREDFNGQRARLRGQSDEAAVTLKGIALRSADGRFEGYEVDLDRPASAPPASSSVFDPALDEALRSPLDRIIAAAERISDRSEGPLRSDYAAYAGDIAAAGRHCQSLRRSG